MLKPSNLHDYQKDCILHMLYNPDSMLWLQMGLGKTIITLTTIVDRIKAGKIKKTIIFGPLRVISSVWETEARKWEHTKHLKFSKLTKTGNRKRILVKDADIFLINYEMMPWLAEKLFKNFTEKELPLPFQCVVYDEVSKLKNSTSLRMRGGIRDRKAKNGEYNAVKFTGWRKLVNEFEYRIGLTGTPASNGYIDLHGQYLAVDGGNRLGEFVTGFRDNFFNKGYNGWSYSITDMGKSSIEAKINDITKKMNARDYLDLPPVLTKDIHVELPVKIQNAYKELEKEMFTELDTGTQVEILNPAALTNKCLQFCNGNLYKGLPTDKKREWEALHDVKLDVLSSVLEEAAGTPVLCSYTFKSDAERMMKVFKKYSPVNLTEISHNKTAATIEKWNKGQIRLLIGHPGSLGYGLDGMQHAGNIIVWFGLNWSLELYEQMNGRLDRMGQTKPVTIFRILCNDTIDLVVKDVIERKITDQEGIKNSLERYRKRKNQVNFVR